jgi:hypothetical protein
MNLIDTTLTTAHAVLLTALAVFGVHRGFLIALWLAVRTRAAEAPAPPAELPHVTVQLPIYNERYVAARLVAAAAAFDYPRDRLEIQVLDDSTDDTPQVVDAAIRALRDDAPKIAHVRRGDRTGFKAGALAHGLARARGDLVAVFDADFVPPRDFLRRTVPFFADARVGMVQARWDHRNADHSETTEVQATLLDGHFLVEHTARSRAGCLFNFNGTAGLFRRACIDDAGGQHDTLTEDMDLSFRAQLRGWRFVYLPELVCPADLPNDMNAFLNQQHRWAKGSIQTARKLLGRILQAPLAPLAKLEAVFHLCGNVAFLLLLGLILIALPLQIVRLLHAAEPSALTRVVESAPLFAATQCVLAYYGLARALAGRLSLGALLRLPLVIAIGAGMCLNNTCAVLGAFRRATGEFVRTPKLDQRGERPPLAYRARRGRLPAFELLLAAWAGTTALLAWHDRSPAFAAFHGLFALGLLWTGAGSLAGRAGRAREPELQMSSVRS